MCYTAKLNLVLIKNDLFVRICYFYTFVCRLNATLLTGIRMKSIKLILSCLSIALATLNMSGQSGGAKQFFELVRIIPDSDKQIKASPLKLLENIILGKEKLQISRPSDIIHRDQGKGWILSQDNGEIIFYDSHGIGRSIIKPKNHPVFRSLVSGCYIKGRGLLFTDSASDSVYMLDEEGRLEKFTDKELLRPTGIAYNSISQTVWIVETGGHRISIFSLDGELLELIGKRGDGPGQFNFPTHIDIDNEGFAYLVDAMNFRIQVFSASGTFISQFGEQGDASGKFARPKGIAVNSQQNIFVADALFNNIQVFDKHGNFLCYFGSRGNRETEFLMPSGLDIDDKDYIYVSDSYNNRIQVFKQSNTEQYE